MSHSARPTETGPLVRNRRSPAGPSLSNAPRPRRPGRRGRGGPLTRATPASQQPRLLAASRDVAAGSAESAQRTVPRATPVGKLTPPPPRICAGALRCEGRARPCAGSLRADSASLCAHPRVARDGLRGGLLTLPRSEATLRQFVPLCASRTGGTGRPWGQRVDPAALHCRQRLVHVVLGCVSQSEFVLMQSDSAQGKVSLYSCKVTLPKAK